MFLLLHNKSLLQCVYTSVFVFVCFALILCFSFFSMTNQVKPTSLSWLNEESLSHLKILEAHLHPTWQHIPFFGNDFEMIEENCCHQNPLPAPPWHSPVWWHVRPKYENILAKEMRLAHQSIVEPLMKKKHFGAMIWKIFLGMFQFSQIFQISTKAERTFEWKVIWCVHHTPLDHTCISSWKLWYTKTPILKLFHVDPVISTLFSKFSGYEK